MMPPRRARELHQRLGKKARRGFRGFPVGTIAFYGPDDRRATKLVAAVIAKEDDPPSDLRRYLVAEGDVRQDPTILEEVVLFFEAHGVRSVAMVDEAWVAAVEMFDEYSCNRGLLLSHFCSSDSR